MIAALVLTLVAGTGPFQLVNGTPGTLSQISVRLAGGRGEWRSLQPGRLSPAARGAVAPLGGEECAFDVRAELDGRELVWRDVNLCDVKVLTLNRRPDGTLWADYD